MTPLFFLRKESMACYHPVMLHGYRDNKAWWNPQGDFHQGVPRTGRNASHQEVPCGRCTGCLLERSRQWAMRCVHEASCHERNIFVTLTYNDESLVWGGDRPTLVPDDLQKFFKRLRKAKGKDGDNIKYFACGEYGSETLRPHYHACIFGTSFDDGKLYSIKNGNKIYESETLDKIWKHGECKIGEVTFESASYVARYCMSKLAHDNLIGSNYYIDHGVEPEFVRMSRRPGIGAAWYQKYKGDLFPQDYAIIRGGIKSPVPRYYGKLRELEHPIDYAYIKKARSIRAGERWEENTRERLDVRETVKNAQLQSLVRDL